MTDVTPNESMSTPRLLNYEAAARWLGIAPQTLRIWVSRGEVPFVRVGRRSVRFRPEDLETVLTFVDAKED